MNGVRFPNLGDIGADSIIVGDVDVAIAAERGISIEFVTAEKFSARQLTDRRGRKAQRGQVEAKVSRAETLLNEAVERNACVANERRRERSDPVHDGGPIEPLEGLLTILARALKNPVGVTVFGAAVLSVTAKDAVLLADDFIHPGDVVIKLVFCEVPWHGQIVLTVS